MDLFSPARMALTVSSLYTVHHTPMPLHMCKYVDQTVQLPYWPPVGQQV